MPGFICLKANPMKTPIQQLTDWFERPIYLDGVVLYERLVGSGFLLTLLKTGEDDYNRQKLTAGLENALQTLQAEEAARQASYPPSLVRQLERGGLLMDERTILKDRMRTCYNAGITESGELKEMAFRILAIKDELDQIYGRRHFFEQNGFLPEAATALPEQPSPDDRLRRRNTLRTYVTKYRAYLLDPLKGNKRKKYERKLAAFLAELHELDTLIDHQPKPL